MNATCPRRGPINRKVEGRPLVKTAGEGDRNNKYKKQKEINKRKTLSNIQVRPLCGSAVHFSINNQRSLKSIM